MANDSNETNLHGTRVRKQKRKLKWNVSLLKLVFWAVWAMGKFFDLIKWLHQAMID